MRDGTQKLTGRALAWVVALLLVAAGSVGFAAPASAAQSDNGHGHAAQGQAHKAQGLSHTKAQHPRQPASSGGSGVGLPRPNDYQVQADPDGLDNGGVDQPGGLGGIDTTTQDGNNGSGNDEDCEDDNRGVGVPGHCRPAPVTAPADEPSVDQTPTDGSAPSGDAVVPDSQVAAPVLAPTLPQAQPAPAQTITRGVFGTSAPPARAAGVLPDTGAGQALLGLAIAALAALAIGAGLVRQGRRRATATR